jgi:hypothetical protein
MEPIAVSSSKNRPLMAFGVFVLTAILTYGSIISPSGNLQSTPYQNRNATAEQKLDRLTGTQGRTVLDGVVVKVKQRATEKGGNPMNATAYNAYLDAYLTKIDLLDNSTRASLGNDYEFLFQYIYPRVHELRMTSAPAVVAANDINRYPGCNADNIFLPNGQVWAACNVGATVMWDGVSQLKDCQSPTDCNPGIAWK